MSAASRRPVQRAGLVVLDCDSTLSAIEGIDELAGARRGEVEALTDAAMRGAVPLEAVYGRRLELIRPDRERLAALGRRYVDALVPDAVAVIAALRDEGVVVRILSGGLLPAVLDVAAAVGVAPADVAAVDVHFGADGAYAGFDQASPLARSRGKCDVLSAWRRELGAFTLMVGDGATDAEAAEVADAFIAYAGVVERPDVLRAADAVIRSRSLAPLLPLALGGATPRRAGHRELYERGLRLLDAPERSRPDT